MDDCFDFVRKHLTPEDCKVLLPKERTRVLDYDLIPENRKEFEMFVNTAPIEILIGFGFISYSSLPEPYRPCPEKMSDMLGEGKELFLFPSEWYAFIPEGFSVITIFAEIVLFQPGQTDNLVRAGCLSYGIAIPPARHPNVIPG